MKVKTFIKYLENIREDEFSHLNDDLSANKRNEGRWTSKDPWDDDYDFDDDSTKDYDDDDDSWSLYNKKSSNPKFDDDDEWSEEDDDSNSDLDHLLYLLRQMFRNAGITDVRVTSVKSDDILIECHMSRKETLRNVIKVFEVANKLKRDILSQYDSEFEIWSSRSGGGVLGFGFVLDEGLGDDNMPF